MQTALIVVSVMSALCLLLCLFLIAQVRNLAHSKSETAVVSVMALRGLVFGRTTGRVMIVIAVAVIVLAGWNFFYPLTQ